MSDSENSALVEAVLYRAAEAIGDITEPVMALFYQRFPQAREMFEYHGGFTTHCVEADMIQQAIYCLMNWFESPGEVEIVLLGSVPHHNDTLKVPPEVYQGLLQATAEVIGDSIPEANARERSAWQSLCRDLDAVIDQSRMYITRPAGAQAS